ncbi:MAG: hypothetical protein BroJett014_26640 [Planctomycetota bacterium]|nr:MAG: hypothetical protein BroJett014_26640 [Planctomycetota bacterium]
MIEHMDRPPSPAASMDPVSALRRALDLAGVRYENVFARREELVVVLPGRGTQRDLAAQALKQTELQGRFFVSIVAEQGLHRGWLTLLAAVCLGLGLFATALMLWGYLGGRGEKSDIETSAPSE